MQRVWSEVVSKDPNNLVKNMKAGLEKVLQEEPFAFLVEANNFYFHHGGDCRIYILPKIYFQSGAGMAVAKDSPIHSVLNVQ